MAAHLAGPTEGLALRRYQVVQRPPDVIELRLVVVQPLTVGQEEALAAWARAKFGAGFRIALACLPELPRMAAGRFEDFVCEVGEAPARRQSRADPSRTRAPMIT